MTFSPLEPIPNDPFRWQMAAPQSGRETYENDASMTSSPKGVNRP